MSEIKIKKERRMQRVQRIRKRLRDNANALRLSVFASNQAMYAQLIDDTKGETVLSVSSKDLKDGKGTKTEQSAQLGTLFAQKAKEKKITDSLVFDKGRYKYHGRVKAFAQAAREGGLKF